MLMDVPRTQAAAAQAEVLLDHKLMLLKPEWSQGKADFVDDVDVIGLMLLLLLKPAMKLSKLTQVHFKAIPTSLMMMVLLAHMLLVLKLKRSF
ncbi:unnamed protein product, partial [Mesorhabditis spiculigera]